MGRLPVTSYAVCIFCGREALSTSLQWKPPTKAIVDLMTYKAKRAQNTVPEIAFFFMLLNFCLFYNGDANINTVRAGLLVVKTFKLK